MLSFASSLVFLAILYQLITPTPSHHYSHIIRETPEYKLYGWDDVTENGCERSGATLELRSNGYGQFKAQVTTSSTQQMIWNSNTSLHGPQVLGGGAIGYNVVRANDDGTPNTINIAYAVQFQPSSFEKIRYADEFSTCIQQT